MQDGIDDVVEDDLFGVDFAHGPGSHPDGVAVHGDVALADEKLAAILLSSFRHHLHRLVPRLRRSLGGVDVDEIVPGIRAVVVIAFSAFHYVAPPERPSRRMISRFSFTR